MQHQMKCDKCGKAIVYETGPAEKPPKSIRCFNCLNKLNSGGQHGNNRDKMGSARRKTGEPRR